MLKGLRITILPFLFANYVNAVEPDISSGTVVMDERPRNQADSFEFIAPEVTTMTFTGNKSFSVRLREQVK